MGFKSFEQEYEPKKQELIVLRHEGGGGLKYNDFWVGAAYFLAYVDVKTDAV